MTDADRPGIGRELPSHFRDKNRYTDTAGTPWQGRDYAESPFPGDDGTAPLVLADALSAVADGEDPWRRELTRVLARTRVLVPIMAVATEEGTTAHGLTGDNGADMAMVSITASDGSRLLPVFSSVDALAAWRKDARPVPTFTPQAAQAAVQEGITQLLLDPSEEGDAVVLQRSIVWALAQGRQWIPPHEDPHLVEELRGIADRSRSVLELHARPGNSSEVDLQVRLEPGLDAQGVQQAVAGLSARLGESVLVADRISSLKLSLAR